ncbi:hypothetical protein LIER_25242 [Lithospermum erythrorhizon]|uniref:Uncharacterized protein n=1 Tax=Lithospermum erythrorhizon TaxID=34254 RepID=A0AAV3R5G2_LITER
MCMQDELTSVPTSTTRFENNVQFVDQTSRESLIKRKILERFFIDIVAGDAVMKERAASKFNDMVGSSDVVKAVEPHILLPRRLSFIMLLLSHDKFVSSARNNSAIILSNTKTKVIHGSYLYMVPTLAVLSH